MDELEVSKTLKFLKQLQEVLSDEEKYLAAEAHVSHMLDDDSYKKIKSDLCLSSVKDASGNIEPNWRMKSAEKLFMEMKGRKIEPNWVTYNLMINGYAQIGKMEDVDRLVAEMKGRNIEPDFVTYNSMINGYAQVKRMEDAERLVVAMKGRNMEPDLVTYNSLINGLVTEMKGRKIKPSLITYNTMLNGYVLVEKIENAEKIFREMKKRRIEPDLDTYLTIIKGYVKSNRLDDGLKLSLEMEGKGLGRTLILTHETNAEYMSDSQLQWVQDFWKKMREEVLALR
ncbi:pentatricopeptide repeat protein [Artemisia annua]|uniref:Pentatricopeptide repeat protein n=1 Tax=Artemisia annua TaxID=35608 RepID=A0A2U1KZ18_ARTAN|nr:pentatricopeptide repeat protein [Artemisia annua]